MTRISNNNQMPTLNQPVETPATTEVQSTTPTSLQPSQSGFEVGTGVQSGTHNPKFGQAPKGGTTFSPLSLQINTAKGLDSSRPAGMDDWTGTQAYFKSDYNYNDAELISGLWNVPVAEAKDIIGTKLMNGQHKALDNLLTEATIAAKNGSVRTDRFDGMDDWSGQQAFFKAGYNYDDAALVAGLWNIPVSEAKGVIGNKLMNGQHKALGNLMTEATIAAKNGSVRTDRFDGMDDWSGTQAYFKSDYNYNDAELIAGFWNMPVAEAKDLIGTKLMHGQHKTLDNLLTEATIAAKNGSVRTPGADEDANNYGAHKFLQSGYTYNDAVKLAGMWDMSVTEAKNFAGQKILDGNGSLINDWWLNPNR